MKGYNHGKKISNETRKKMSESARRTRNGFKVGHENYIKEHSTETKKKLSEYAKSIGRKPVQPKGYKHSDETRKKLVTSHIGNKSGSGNKGKVTSTEVRKKISESSKGEKGNNWKGGITSVNNSIRRSIETRLWRESVFSRDNWTCQKYGIKGGVLHAHHIQNFAQYSDLRFAIDNGITLSDKAHKEFHKKYGIRNNTREQIEEFINNI